MVGLPVIARSETRAPERADRLRRGSVVLWLVAFAAILFGIKLFFIGTYGNATPFWDQWGGESDLYKAALEHRLTWRGLVAPHVVHRILTWRLHALALFTANGVWNPLLQMVVNAALWAGALGVFVVLLDRATGRRHLLLLLAFALMAFALPYGNANMLWGMQGTFYFFIFWTTLALWCIAVAAPFSVGWWGGIACGLLGFLSLGSGAFTAAAATVIAVAQYASGVRRDRLQVASIAVLAGLFVVGVLLTKSHESTDGLRASTLGHWLSALAMTASWPLRIGPLGPLIAYWPALMLAVAMHRRPPQAGDARWFLLAAATASLGQAAAIAYGRAVGCLSDRYLDMFAVGLLVNFACALAVAPEFANRGRAIATLVAWTGVMLGSLTVYTLRHARAEMVLRRDVAVAQREYTRAYVLSGDVGHLQGKPPLHVPYPDPDVLATMLDDPVVRSFLPDVIAPPLPATAFASEPREAFVEAGPCPGLPPRDEPCWSSHGPAGPQGSGAATVTFGGPHRGHAVKLPVAVGGDGTGISIEVEQDGERTPLPVPTPSGTWTPVRIKVRGRPFTLHVADTSPNGWVAVAAPTVEGRFDRHVDRLLGRWDWFVGGGIVLVLALFVHEAVTRTDA